MIVRYYEQIDSTNVQAQKEAAEGAENGTLIVADMQTAGRGRRGREWSSPAGKNIYFSLLLRPELEPDKASMLTLVMALAVSKGMQRSMEALNIENKKNHMLRPEIKWPNDIVMNGKKVCGILTEMGLKQKTIDYVVIGVGINVHSQEFAPEIVDTATCLDEECGKRVSRKLLLNHVVEAFEEYYEIFMQQKRLEGLRFEYEELLVNRNREVSVLDPQGEYRGVAKGITDTGELLVELADGSTTKVYAGEVSVRGIYGYV